MAVFVKTVPLMLWISTAMLGAGYATVMPSSFTWSTTFMEVTGHFSAVYWCGYFTGFMTIPALAGYLMENVHHLCLVYVMIACGIGMGVTFAVQLYLVNSRRNVMTTKEMPAATHV